MGDIRYEIHLSDTFIVIVANERAAAAAYRGNEEGSGARKFRLRLHV